LLAFAAMLTTPLAAHDIITTNLTYTHDISGILVRRCLACHGSGASIPLTRYEDVRPWAVDIKEQVLSRAMPPWGAVKGFGDLKPDHALTQEEIIIIAAWVIGGAPKGNPALTPKATPKSVAAAANPDVRDLQIVETRTALDNATMLAGLRPLTQSVDSARITAHLPDGRIQPLVWLYQFNAKSNRVFFFREPLALPKGTTIESSEPLRFALEVARK